MRILRKDEVVRAGDQFQSPENGNRWKPVTASIGKTVEECLTAWLSITAYRRPTRKAKKGVRHGTV
jgi:hypothetical protein